MRRTDDASKERRKDGRKQGREVGQAHTPPQRHLHNGFRRPHFVEFRQPVIAFQSIDIRREWRQVLPSMMRADGRGVDKELGCSYRREVSGGGKRRERERKEERKEKKRKRHDPRLFAPLKRGVPVTRVYSALVAAGTVLQLAIHVSFFVMKKNARSKLFPFFPYRWIHRKEIPRRLWAVAWSEGHQSAHARAPELDVFHCREFWRCWPTT